MQNKIEKLKSYLRKSNNGTSLLFTGAGFSYGAKNLLGESPKNSRALSRALCEFANLDPDDDLYYSSEYCLQNKPRHELIDLLKKEFTISSISESHKKIASKKWRRIYTTNYDHVFEHASTAQKKACESVNINIAPSQYVQKNQCVHLNGSIENLTLSTLNDDFKLSDSSYVTPDTLSSSKWKSVFTIDVEHSSAIFFVGYSMYDLDIKRVIKSDFDIKEKTFFIVKPGEDKKEIFKLERYGTVIDMGVDAFSDLVFEIISNDTTAQAEDLEFFRKHSVTERVSEPTDNQTRDLFLKGAVIESEIHLSTFNSTNYLIKRDELEKYSRVVADGRNLVITGDIASGKTIFLKQILSLLSNQGRDVFFISNEEGNYKKDAGIIEEISSSPVFAIDNAFRHEQVICDLHAKFSSRATFILAGRSEFLERTKIQLEKIDVTFIEHSVDFLSSDEIFDLNKICNHIGFWGLNNSWPDSRKQSFLSGDCESKFSSILLEYFKSDYVKGVFEEHLSILKDRKNSKIKEIVLIVSLLGLLPFSPKKSLISDFVKNEDIYETEFWANPIVKTLLNLKGGQVEVASGVLSQFVLDRYFSGSEIVDKVIDMVSHLSNNKGDGVLNSIFKELLRFKNINFMLPDQQRGVNLNDFFHKLKLAIGWLKNSPHFWLQYGMANMFLYEYQTAKQYFENAYGAAKNDETYDVKYIDNQMARWHLEFGLTKIVSKDVFHHFQEAYSLLKGQEVDYYFSKQALLIEKYYSEHYQLFSRKEKTEFEKMCKNLLRHIQSNNQGEVSRRGYVEELNNMLSSIIHKIADQRRTVEV